MNDLLALIAFLAVVLLVGVIFVVAVARIASVERMADPEFQPDLDRHEARLRDALGDEAACHDTDNQDGMVIDWDDEMRRRGR